MDSSFISSSIFFSGFNLKIWESSPNPQGSMKKLFQILEIKKIRVFLEIFWKFLRTRKKRSCVLRGVALAVVFLGVSSKTPVHTSVRCLRRTFADLKVPVRCISRRRKTRDFALKKTFCGALTMFFGLGTGVVFGSRTCSGDVVQKLACGVQVGSDESVFSVQKDQKSSKKSWKKVDFNWWENLKIQRKSLKKPKKPKKVSNMMLLTTLLYRYDLFFLRYRRCTSILSFSLKIFTIPL